MSVFPPIPAFSFATASGNALHKNKPVQNCVACRKRKTKCDRLWPCTPCKNRGEADSCEQHVRESNDRPTGYTHVSDTSILANRVAQLEHVLSRLITRLDSPDAYLDLLHDFEDPLPVVRLNAKSEDDKRSGDIKNKRARLEQSSTAPESTRDSSFSRPPSMQPNDAAIPSRLMDTPHRAQMAPPPVGFSVSQDLNILTQDSEHGELLDSIMVETSPTDQPAYMPQSHPTEPDWVHSQTFHGVDADPLNLDSFNRPLAAASALRNPSAEPMSKAPSAHEHEAAMVLEGLALGRGYQPEQRDRVDSLIHETISAESPPSPQTFTSFIQQKQPSTSNLERRAFPSAMELPNAVVGKYIMNHFFDDVDFMWRCLHRPTFERQYTDLCLRLRARPSDFTLDELSTLALYAACLAVGFHFLGDDEYQDLNMDEDQAIVLAARCWKISYSALEASDWLQVNNIKSCQTIIIAGLYLSSVRRANQHWNLLGVATKIAMSLGLAKVPDESKISAAALVGQVPPRWRSAIDREVGRRVWHCLVEHDYLFSMEHDFLFLIAPELQQTSEPANINDIDIVDDKPVVSLPKDVHTEMSYFLQRLQILRPLQSLVRGYRTAGRMHYNFVVDAHRSLEHAHATRPKFYQSPDSLDAVFDAAQLSRIKREAKSMQEATDLRTMRIHRYYFPASCSNPRYRLTKDACLASAKRLLSRSPNGQQTSAPLSPHYWAMTYSIFLATTITIIYLFYAPAEELESLKAQAQAGIDQLVGLSGRGSTDLGDTADTLVALLAIQLDRRNPTQTSGLNKRNFDDLNFDDIASWLPMGLDEMSSGTMSTSFAAPTAGLDDDTSLDWLQDVSRLNQTLAMWARDGINESGT